MHCFVIDLYGNFRCHLDDTAGHAGQPGRAAAEDGAADHNGGQAGRISADEHRDNGAHPMNAIKREPECRHPGSSPSPASSMCGVPQ